MREIKFYNTFTNDIEVFKPIKEGEVSMYVCGPTVYNDPHIGNMRPVVFFDTFSRFLKYIGYNVKYVSNITDVDDKIINKAIENNTTEKEITNHYINEYFNCLRELNVQKAYANPKVTDYMDSIISYIDKLVQLDAAYVNDGEVFFDVLKDDRYGELSKVDKDSLISGARVEENTKKKSPLDFLLWKKTEKGIKWHTPWCDGRPGWHTECCVMIDTIFNGMIDIHGGGMDLRFPHHENEIAQAEAMHHNHLANYWIHNAMMNIKGEKMSKSLGNVILAKDAIKEYGGDLIRLTLLNAPYRSIINFSDETIADSHSILQKFETVFKQLNLEMNVNNLFQEGYKPSNGIEPFLEALSNDINIANGITAMLEVIKNSNIELRKREKDFKAIKEYFYTLVNISFILGLSFKPNKFNKDDLDLYNEYIEAKKNKDFEKSDTLRKQLFEKKIL